MARGRGEGSIHKRKDGLWAAQISLGIDSEGKRIRPMVYGKTKREVQEKMLALQQDAMNGVPVKPERITVGEHFEDWLRAKKPSIRSSTYNKYSRHYHKHIKAAFAGLQLKALDYRRINAFYELLDEKGLAKRTVFDIAAILRSGLEDAVKKGLIPQNPAKLAASRSSGAKEARFLNQDEIRAFLQAAEGERFQYAFIVALHTGLRPGELLGLSWDTVDWKGRKLTVRQALHEEEGKVFLGDVKTKAGRRTISLSEAAIHALKSQRRLQLETQIACRGEWKNEANLVFTNLMGGPLRRTNIAKRDMKRILKRAGLKDVTLHTFRHTHASVLIFQGVDIKTISRRLGHENISITLQTYGHLMPGQDERAAERMDQFTDSLLSAVNRQ